MFLSRLTNEGWLKCQEFFGVFLLPCFILTLTLDITEQICCLLVLFTQSCRDLRAAAASLPLHSLGSVTAV